MSVGSEYAKMRRGASANHTDYGFHRSTMPPGSDNSNSPAATAGVGFAVVDGVHSAKSGRDDRRVAGLRRCALRCFHFENVLFEIFLQRQKDDSDKPLAAYASKIASHSDDVRLTFPFD